MELWRASEHEALTDRAWDLASAERAIDEIVQDAERAARDWRWPAHPHDDVREDEVFWSRALRGAHHRYGIVLIS